MFISTSVLFVFRYIGRAHDTVQLLCVDMLRWFFCMRTIMCNVLLLTGIANNNGYLARTGITVGTP